MVDYEYSDLFSENSISKQIIIEFDNSILTNEDLYNQEMTLEESLCSKEELRFGCCEASVLKFKISDIFSPMIGKWLDVKMIVDKNAELPFSIGKYRVSEDNLSADRRYREIVAYDAMYDIINSSVINWYNTILPDKDSKVTMKQFRTSFVKYFGLEQQETALINDDMIVEKTILVEEGVETDNDIEQVSILKESSLSGLDIITAICEINGCFGHIGRDGRFHYIYLQQNIQGLYPADDLFPDHAPDHLPQSKTGHLYPQDPKSNRIEKNEYIECNYENFFTKTIDRLQIRQEENDIGQTWPETGIQEEENRYIIEDNFLVYGKSEKQLSVIAENIYKKICNISYRPFECDTIGNPCFEVGDPVRFLTGNNIIESYILQRTMSGIQALRDTFIADGTEKYLENVNGIQNSIIQLKGKTNTLKRNVEETKFEIKNVESGLSSRITQLVDSISMEVENGADGKTAKVILRIQDGESIYEVVSDKINFTGLVSFKNLENEGETKINGGNLEAKTVSCDVLDGGVILGQVIEGGSVTGATIKAKEGLYLQYINTNTRPPISGEYVFAKTGYNLSPTGGFSNDSFLELGKGGTSVVLGNMYSEDGSVEPMAYFPKAAIMAKAKIDSLWKTDSLSGSFVDESGSSKVNVEARAFGPFVYIYGTYETHLHETGVSRSIVVTESGSPFTPEEHSAWNVGYTGSSILLFGITPNGEFVIRNSSGRNVVSQEGTSVNFRIDFFRSKGGQ